MAVVRKLPATVSHVARHTEDVCTYTFTPDGKVPRFKPGQFLHLALDEYDPSRDWPESRVFSIASSPTRRNSVRVTISAKGNFTSRIVEELREGSKVWLKLPYGDFSIKEQTDPIVLIAGGTGVAPFISYLEHRLDKPSSAPVSLYYGVRSPEHFIFGDVLRDCEEKLEQFNAVTYMEYGETDGARPGILDINAIHAEVDESATFYLSGPWAMIEALRGALADFGVPPEHIRIDEWE